MARAASRASVDLPAIVADIGELVSVESPSHDPAALEASARAVASLGTRLLGVPPEFVGDEPIHLRWRFGDQAPRVLLLAHHDTVWPVGSLARHPFAVADGRLTGPGSFDMKAGLVLALHAIARLPRRDGVVLLVTGDEEIGSPGSRALIESEAAGCRAALVLEGAADGGALKTRRKGVSFYEIVAEGRAAHAGLEPERGINASLELAHQIVRISGLEDAAAGTSVVPTVIAAGTAANTVPDRAQVHVDVRAWTAGEQDRVDRALHSLHPILGGAVITVTGGVNRAPLEAASSDALFERARQIAARAGDPPLGAAAVGGGSDGNFTAGIGVPTLDGLGAVGGGAHADDEHVLLDALPARLLLVSELIAELRGDRA